MDMNGPAEPNSLNSALVKKDPDNAGPSRGARFLLKKFENRDLVTNIDIMIAGFFDALEISESCASELAQVWGDRDPDEFHRITGSIVGEYR